MTTMAELIELVEFARARGIVQLKANGVELLLGPEPLPPVPATSPAKARAEEYAEEMKTLFASTDVSVTPFLPKPEPEE